MSLERRVQETRREMRLHALWNRTPGMSCFSKRLQSGPLGQKQGMPPRKPGEFTKLPRIRTLLPSSTFHPITSQ